MKPTIVFLNTSDAGSFKVSGSLLRMCCWVPISVMTAKRKRSLHAGIFTAGGKEFRAYSDIKSIMHTDQPVDYGACLEEDLEFIAAQTFSDKKELSDRYWETFIIDALIANWDRDSGNWGFLYDQQTQITQPAPVFDCGSCLFSTVSEQFMETILSDQSALEQRVYQSPLSAIKEQGKRIKYFDFISSLKNEDCNRALRRLYDRIHLQEIIGIIEETPYASDLRKEFYKTILAARKKHIIDYSFEKLIAAGSP